MNKLLRKIDEIVNEALEQHLPDIKKDMLEENGNIYYMNDIDGTLFDWGMNERLCEFMMFYDKSGMGAIKLNVLHDGKVNIYLYRDKANSSFRQYSKKIFTEEEVYELVVLMYNIADKKELYGKSIYDMVDSIQMTDDMYSEFKSFFEE